jgi:hypothetical protein
MESALALLLFAAACLVAYRLISKKKDSWESGDIGGEKDPPRPRHDDK